MAPSIHIQPAVCRNRCVSSAAVHPWASRMAISCVPLHQPPIGSGASGRKTQHDDFMPPHRPAAGARLPVPPPREAACRRRRPIKIVEALAIASRAASTGMRGAKAAPLLEEPVLWRKTSAAAFTASPPCRSPPPLVAARRLDLVHTHGPASIAGAKPGAAPCGAATLHAGAPPAASTMDRQHSVIMERRPENCGFSAGADSFTTPLATSIKFTPQTEFRDCPHVPVPAARCGHSSSCRPRPLVLLPRNLIFGRGVIDEVAPFTLALGAGPPSPSCSPLSCFLGMGNRAPLLAENTPASALAFLGMWVCGAIVYLALA